MIARRRGRKPTAGAAAGRACARRRLRYHATAIKRHPEPAKNELPPPPPRPRRRGLIDAGVIRWISFTVTAICLLICIVACILSIWDMARRDVMWRTISTCAVIAGGMMAFSLIN